MYKFLKEIIKIYIFVTEIAETLCYLLTGSSEQCGANVEVSFLLLNVTVVNKIDFIFNMSS